MISFRRKEGLTVTLRVAFKGEVLHSSFLQQLLALQYLALT